jgi:hypothetical protein
MFMSQKRIKLDSLMNAASNGLNPLAHTTSGSNSVADSPPPTVRSPQPSVPHQVASLLTSTSGSSPPNLNGGSSTSSSAASRRSTNQNANNSNLLNSIPGLFSSSNSTQPVGNDDFSSAMAAMASFMAPPLDDSPNALFGRLVANEMDKLPPGMHNIVRAQVLLLLAQSSQQSQNGASATTDRIISCLTP